MYYRAMQCKNLRGENEEFADKAERPSSVAAATR